MPDHPTDLRRHQRLRPLKDEAPAVSEEALLRAREVFYKDPRVEKIEPGQLPHLYATKATLQRPPRGLIQPPARPEKTAALENGKPRAEQARRRAERHRQTVRALATSVSLHEAAGTGVDAQRALSRALNWPQLSVGATLQALRALDPESRRSLRELAYITPLEDLSREWRLCLDPVGFAALVSSVHFAHEARTEAGLRGFRAQPAGHGQVHRPSIRPDIRRRLHTAGIPVVESPLSVAIPHLQLQWFEQGDHAGVFRGGPRAELEWHPAEHVHHYLHELSAQRIRRNGQKGPESLIRTLAQAPEGLRLQAWKWMSAASRLAALNIWDPLDPG